MGALNKLILLAKKTRPGILFSIFICIILIGLTIASYTAGHALLPKVTGYTFMLSYQLQDDYNYHEMEWLLPDAIFTTKLHFKIQRFDYICWGARNRRLGHAAC